MPNDSMAANAAATRFAHLGAGMYGMLPLAWAPHMHGERMIKVFWALCAHVGSDSSCYPSRAQIARLTGIDERHVQRTLRELEKIGALETRLRRGHSSVYRLMPPPQSKVGADSASPQKEVGADSASQEGADSASPPRADSAPHNRPRNRVFNRPSRARARAGDDGQEKTNDDESRTTAFNAEENDRKTTLRQPTDGEARVLAVCWQWQRGVSMPMPADLVELYRAMRPVYDLPQRPGA
jgi:Helix-turn-helix domain